MRPGLVFTSLALLGLAGALPLLSQSAPHGTARSAHRATAPAIGSYRIAGVVVNAVTGEPVRRANVAVLDEADSHTVAAVESDGEGKFELADLPAAKYQLTAAKRGFRTAFYDEHEEFNSAIVTGPDQDTGHLTFRLMPGAVLHGVVSADGGDPVEGARVMLFEQPSHHRQGARITQADTALTDDTGAYEFSNLAAGEYLLAVVAEPWYALQGETAQGRTKPATENSAALDVAYPVTYFDSTTDEASATPIALAGGSREEANINLHPVPALRLAVAAPRKADGSIARTELRQTVFGIQSTALSAGTLDAIHSRALDFTGLAPGHYELLQGDPPRITELEAASSQQVDPDAGSPAPAVTGILRMATGQPLPDEVNLTLDLLDGTNSQNELATVSHHGRFTFDAVPPGTWSLSAASGSKILPVVSMGAGSAMHSGGLLMVRDRPLSELVTLSQGDARVEGFALKGGKGFAGAMIVLAPRDSGAWQALIRRDQSDSDGSFALRDVAPGQYTVIAIEDGWELDWSRPEMMARYLQKGITVSINSQSGNPVRVAQPVTVQPR
jgi:hypothetical protein